MRAAANLLRILHVNKFAHIVGGVETHMRELMEHQSARGSEVDVFSVADVAGTGFDAAPSGARAKLQSATTLLWSRPAEQALGERIAAFKPDVVHFHGIYHQLSPSVLAAARKAGVASVMTLHDYKLAAPCYLLFRGHEECTLCVGRTVPVDAVRYRCVKGSLSGSALCAVEQAVHRFPYRRGVDAFIVPSEAARVRVSRAPAVDAARVHVVPHGLALPAEPVDLDRSANRVVFFGRLAPEKGAGYLLEAWKEAQLGDDWELVLAGDGAERTELERLATKSTRFLGHIEGPELVQVLRTASFVVVPSLFPETFGLSAAEAMSHGIPTLVSDRGNLPDLIGDSTLVVPGNDVPAWAAAMRRLASSLELRRAVGDAGRRRIESEFSLTSAMSGTDSVYEAALSLVEGRRGKR